MIFERPLKSPMISGSLTRTKVSRAGLADVILHRDVEETAGPRDSSIRASRQHARRREVRQDSRARGQRPDAVGSRAGVHSVSEIGSAGAKPRASDAADAWLLRDAGPLCQSGARSPGELSHSLICEPVSHWRALRKTSCRSVPGGSSAASLHKRTASSARRYSRGSSCLKRRRIYTWRSFP